MGGVISIYRMASLPAGVLLGTAVQLQQPELWPALAYAGLVLSGVVVAWLGWWAGRRPGRAAAVIRVLTTLLAVAALSAAWAGLRAGERWADRLPAAREGADLWLRGRVEGLPHVEADGLRFLLAVEPGNEPVPTRVLLNWRGDQASTGLGGEAPAPLRAGERWELPVRLRQVHGEVNPGGFDAELWLFEQGVGAVGTVQARRPGEARRLEGPRWWHPGDQLDAWRQRWRDRILLTPATPATAGLMAALAVGDQSAIGSADWDIYRRTGIAHLVSISGMHITLFAWLAAAVVGRLWRLFPGLLLTCPAPNAARWGGLTLAWLYALVAGWGVPAQRTVLMLALATGLRQAGTGWPGGWIWAVAGALVLLRDPWALLQPGFWLSFVAVGLLMTADRPASDDEAGPAWRRAVREGWRAQWIVTVGLAPLTLVLFGQVSLVGWLANLVAVPVITWLITPLALAGVLWADLWTLGAWLLQPLLHYLQWLVQGPLAPVAVGSVPQVSVFAGGLAVLGGLWLVAPLPLRWRLLAGPLWLPLIWPVADRPRPGEFELVAADVGQGSAVLVRTAHHLLVHDAGPQLGRDADAGHRVLLPLLQALGDTRIDELVLSHGDLDHVGGAPALLAERAPLSVRSSLPARHPLLRSAPQAVTCAAGQRWVWDGVSFEVLHPPPGADLEPPVPPNHVSCVLRIEDAVGRSALPTGDIEAGQEAALVHQLGPQLRSTVLIVPHHGSHTSSTREFLQAVQPDWAVIQVGYRSRYGHPHADVLQRYQTLGLKVVRTDHCGAWRWSPARSECARQQDPRYWRWKLDPDAAQGGLFVARVGIAGERE